MSDTGARSAGIAGSIDPAGTTVTRRSRSVSAASGVTCPPFASSTVAPRSICRASASVMIWNTLVIGHRTSDLGPRTSDLGRRTSDLGPRSLLQHRDVRQVPVLLRVIQPVADDEVILDREADVIHLHVDLAPRRLAQEARGLQRF